MRILITVPWGARMGGAETMLQTVLDGALQSEHELQLVFFEPGPWPEELAQASFDVEVIPAGRVRQAHRLLACIWRLSRLLRRRQPDLIVNWMPKTQLYCAPAALLAGMSDRVVWWQHEIPTRHWLDRLATVLPAAAVGCSSSAAALAQEKLSPRRRTFVVAPGTRVPAPAAEPAPLELPDGVPIVGLVGRLQPWKGQDRLLRAQLLLRERGQRVHTLIVGGDAHGLSSQYAESLPALVSSLGLSGEVTLTGQVSDAGPYIERMDVMVNASDPEPFGIVLLEAMARGVPVVAVGSGGPLEILRDERGGVLADSGEPAALADALEALLVSEAARSELGRQGRERFMEEYTDVAMRTRFFKALQSLREDLDLATPVATENEVTIVAHDIGPVGGMERQLVQLITGLRRLGHEVTVIGRVCELPPDSGVTFRRVPGPKRPFLLAYPWFLIIGTLAVRRWRRGVVQMTGAIVLNRVDAAAVHYCHHAGVATPARATPLRRIYIRLVAQLNRAVERLCYGRTSEAVFVCVSDGVADEMRHYFPSAAEQVMTIHNGVDLEAFAPGTRVQDAQELRRSLQIAPQRAIAAFVGSEWERKGLEPAIRALAEAPAWDLVVAGGGDRERYERLAVSLGVAHNVHWLGVTRDVPLVMALADALVFPSTYEAFPLVALEAAASGLAILATPVNGVRELIRDGVSGLLVEQDPRSIAAGLQRLSDDPSLLTSMGEAARAAVLEFSWDRMVLRHHELYAALRAASAPAGRSRRGR